MWKEICAYKSACVLISCGPNFHGPMNVNYLNTRRNKSTMLLNTAEWQYWQCLTDELYVLLWKKNENSVLHRNLWAGNERDSDGRSNVTANVNSQNCNMDLVIISFCMLYICVSIFFCFLSICSSIASPSVVMLKQRYEERKNQWWIGKIY